MCLNVKSDFSATDGAKVIYTGVNVRRYAARLQIPLLQARKERLIKRYQCSEFIISKTAIQLQIIHNHHVISHRTAHRSRHRHQWPGECWQRRPEFQEWMDTTAARRRHGCQSGQERHDSISQARRQQTGQLSTVATGVPVSEQRYDAFVRLLRL